MRKQAFNTDWNYAISETDVSFRTAVTWNDVELPHDFIPAKGRNPHNAGSGQNGFYGDGQCIYKKTFDFPAEMSGSHVFLDIDGAYMNAEVILNKELLAQHPYGYSPFLVDLTDYIKPGGNNILEIFTQSRQPASRWYSGGGLYRQVSLWTGNQVHIGPWDMFVTTPEISNTEAVIRIQADISNYRDIAADVTVRFKVYAGNFSLNGGEVSTTVAARGKQRVELDFTMQNPHKWDIDDPFLYTLRAEVIENGELIDEHETIFGIRKIEVDSYNGFRLNGKPMKLKGGCIHHDNGLLGATAFPRAEERKIQLLKNAGYNAVRSAHNPTSMAMLEACDRNGMLLLEEAFDFWRESKRPMDYHLWFEDWWERDIQSMVLRDRNHPCVIIYSIGNEISERDGHSRGVIYSRKLAEKVLSLDDTRFVTQGVCNVMAPVFDENCEEQPVTNFDFNLLASPTEGEDIWADRTKDFCKPLDIVGYNYMFDRYALDRKKFPDRVICGTESMAATMYENWAAVCENPNVIGDFNWSAFDYLGEVGIGRLFWPEETRPGYMSEYPWRTAYCSDFNICGGRNPQSYYREIMWGCAAGPRIFALHPLRYGQEFGGIGWHWEDVKPDWSFGREFEGKPVHVCTYVDADEVEYILNGRSVGKSKVNRFRSVITVSYMPGILEAVARKNGDKIGRDRIITAEEPNALKLASDRMSINADGEDLAYVNIDVVDRNGFKVFGAEQKIMCSVSGAGSLAAVGSANPKSEDDWENGVCHVYEGCAMAIIRASRNAGVALLTISTDGMEQATFEIEVIPIKQKNAHHI